MNILNIISDDKFDRVDWALLSPKGIVIDKGENELLSNLVKKIDQKGTKIRVLLATADINIREVTVPKNISKAMVQKIVPTLLEDELLSNVETIHFSALKKSADKVTVALVSKEKLSEWQQVLSSLGITPQAISPLCLFLNTPDAACGIWLRNNLAVVKVDEGVGFVFEPENLPMLLQAYYEKQQKNPHSILFLNSNDELASKINFAAYPELMALQEKQAVGVWQAVDVEQKNINLLPEIETFGFQKLNIKKLFYHTMGILLFAFVLSLCLEIWTIVKLEKKNEELTAEIHTVYKQLYPHATEVVSPQLRIQGEIKSLTNAKTASFYELLFTAGNALQQNPYILLQSINFKNEKLSLTIETNTYPEIEKLIAQLKKTSLMVKQESTEQQDKKYKATISLTKAK